MPRPYLPTIACLSVTAALFAVASGGPFTAAPAFAEEAAAPAAPVERSYRDELVARAGDILAAPQPDYELAATLLSEAAKVGAPDAMLTLAALYRDGNGVARDYAAAEKLLKEAIAAGRIADGNAGLGDLFSRAEPPFRDPAKAVAAYEAAVALGNAPAMVSLARLVASGDGTAPDFDRARDLYEAAAAAGAGLQALPLLGDLYRDAAPDNRNLALAADAYQKAAYLGDPFSMVSLARIVASGEAVPRDASRAVRLLESAVAIGGPAAAPAWNALGDVLRNAPPADRDAAKAVAAYEEASKLGDAWATLSLAQMLGAGEGAPKNFARAKELLEKTIALGGDTTKWAWGSLGDLLRNADGEDRDLAAAAEAYATAVALGNPPAMINLARMTAAGDGVTQDFAAAVALLEKAIAAGAGLDAGFVLGDLYRNAAAGNRDLAKAAEAYEVAAEAGSPWAKIALGQMLGTGDGVADDFPRAVALLEDTVAGGGEAAKWAWNTLGDIYRSGAAKNPSKAAAAYREAIAMGAAPAMISLARMTAAGEGVAASFSGAVALFEQAIAAGAGMDAGLLLGDLYRAQGPNRDAAKAVAAYETASGLGNPWAAIALAQMLGAGEGGVPSDFDRALALLDETVAKGGAPAPVAWRVTGDLYRNATPADPAKAIDAYQQAIAAGDAPAMISLARMYAYGEGVAADFDVATALLDRAIGAGAGADAGLVLGDLWRNQPPERADAAKAVEAYEVASDLGNPWASLALAQMVGRGDGVTADFPRAVALLEETAAKGGDTEKFAWATLGDLYRSASPPNGDTAKAVAAYEKAIAAGSTPAMISLARMYAEGVPNEFEKARDLLERALAAGGASDAGLMLGDLYMQPGPDRPDPAKALGYFEAAAKAGNGAADLAAARLLGAGEADAAGREAMVTHFRDAAARLGPDVVAREMFNLRTPVLYAAVQDLLTRAGQQPGPVDGVFGGRMQAAIDRFCARSGVGSCGRGIVPFELVVALLRPAA